MTNKDKDIQRTQLQIHMKLKCEIVVISDSWEPEFMTIIVTQELRVTLDSIRNSCDVSTVTETADFIPNQEDMYIVCTDIFEIVFKLQLKLNHLSGINRSVSWSSSDLLSLQQQRRPWMQSKRPKKHRKNCECCHHHSVFKGHNIIVHIVVLNCQKCNQCLKCQVSGHKNFQKI